MDLRGRNRHAADRDQFKAFIGLQVRSDLKAALEQAARARNTTLSFLARQILVTWLRAQAPAQKGAAS